jgi:hypothetical protein
LDSGLPLNTEAYKIQTNEDNFTEFGMGYVLIFKIIRSMFFFFLLVVLPIAITLMFVYSTGVDCKDKDPTMKKLITEVNGHDLTKNRDVCGDLDLSKILHEHKFDKAKEIKETLEHDHVDEQEFELSLNGIADYANEQQLKASTCWIRSLYSKFLAKFYDEVCEKEEEGGAEHHEHKSEQSEQEEEKILEFCKDYEEGVEIVMKKTEMGEADARKEVILNKHEFVKHYEENFVFDQCQDNLFNRISISNRHEYFKKSWIDATMFPAIEIGFFSILIIALLAFDYWHEKNYVDFVKYKKKSIGEFTLMIESLPYGKKYQGNFDIKSELTKILEQDPDNHGLDSNDKIKIKEFSFGFEAEEFEELKDEMHELIQEEFRLKLEDELKEVKGSGMDHKFKEDESLLDEKSKLEEEKDHLKKKIINMQNSFLAAEPHHMVGVAFVTLENPVHIDHLVRTYNPENLYSKVKICNKKKRLKMKDPVSGKMRSLIITQAPEPGDIKWHHLGMSKCEKRLREFFSTFLIFLICAVSFWVIYQFDTLEVS